jgi:cobalt-zinc-cadmium efflux system outer membrane protein
MPALFPLRRGRGPRCRATLPLVALLIASPGWSAPAATSFEDAVRIAVERAPALDARRSQTVAAREEAVRAAALPDPKLTLGLANWPVTGADAFGLGADDMTMKQIGLMQEFPARAKRQARQILADRGIEQAEALSVAERSAVRRAAAEAWIALWATQREVEGLNALRQQSALAVRLSKARLAQGVGTAVETLAVQAAALDLSNRIDAAQASMEAARGTLARWLGEGGDAPAADGAPPDLMRLPVAEATLLTSLDRQAPLLPWRSREALAEAEVTLAAAEKRPDWSVAAAYGQRDGSRSDMLTIEFAIDLPIFAGRRQDRGVAARRAELASIAASHEDARRAQGEAIRRGLAEWNGLKRQVTRAEQETLPLAHDRAQTALASYGHGGELQPWLDARRDEIERQVEYARQLRELGRSWAALAFLLPAEESTP